MFTLYMNYFNVFSGLLACLYCRALSSISYLFLWCYHGGENNMIIKCKFEIYKKMNSKSANPTIDDHANSN